MAYMCFCTGAHHFIMHLRAWHLYCCKYSILHPHLSGNTPGTSVEVLGLRISENDTKSNSDIRFMTQRSYQVTGKKKKKRKWHALRQENSRRKYEAFFLSKQEPGTYSTLKEPEALLCNYLTLKPTRLESTMYFSCFIWQIMPSPRGFRPIL